MKKKRVIFSECGELAFGQVKEFVNVDNFKNAIHEQYHEEFCHIEKVKIEPCISTIEGISAETIVPLSETDAVIRNYFVAEIGEVGMAGAEKSLQSKNCVH